MKRIALVKERPVPGAALKEVDVPELGPKDVLVKVKAAAICGTDIHIYAWNDWARARVRPPMIFGHEFCGEVVETGEDVTQLSPGDLVAAETHIPCGACFQCRTGAQHICRHMAILGVHTDGAFTDYAVIPEICAWKLPPQTDPEVGAIYEPFGVAAHGVLMHNLAGCSVAVFGCGPIGLFAVGIARAAGASHVFAVDVIDTRLRLATQMGATMTFNPNKQDVPAAILAQTKGAGVDCFIELSGSPAAVKQGFAALRNGGAVSLIGLPAQPVTLDLTQEIIYKEARVFGSTGRGMFDTWYRVTAFLESGLVDPRPVITHRFSLSDYDKAFEVLIKTEDAGKVILLP
ncbi:MAG: L-threonine 3-dehydrogenase [Firmicutes bacterium]|nr:L-threonine 3-dehydrogenase [Bacillota bacterium]MDH7494760.1 L-threonine 3-dehydrogenase [Bacillota bacterium]